MGTLAEIRSEYEALSPDIEKHSPKGPDGKFLSHTETFAAPESGSIKSGSAAHTASCKNCGRDIHVSARGGSQWTHADTGRACAVAKEAAEMQADLTKDWSAWDAERASNASSDDHSGHDPGSCPVCDNARERSTFGNTTRPDDVKPRGRISEAIHQHFLPKGDDVWAVARVAVGHLGPRIVDVDIRDQLLAKYDDSQPRDDSGKWTTNTQGPTTHHYDHPAGKGGAFKATNGGYKAVADTGNGPQDLGTHPSLAAAKTAVENHMHMATPIAQGGHGQSNGDNEGKAGLGRMMARWNTGAPSEMFPGETTLSCPKCGSTKVTVTGNSPYGAATPWQEVSCKNCGNTERAWNLHVAGRPSTPAAATSQSGNEHPPVTASPEGAQHLRVHGFDNAKASMSTGSWAAHIDAHAAAHANPGSEQDLHGAAKSHTHKGI
jgi:transcription elongation factor Elf1